MQELSSLVEIKEDLKYKVKEILDSKIIYRKLKYFID
jgi:hypothetical protein